MSKGEQTRQEIVARAVAMAGRLGLEGVTLGALAASLELSKSGLFAHFRSKEALQVAVVTEVIGRFTRQVLLPALDEPRGARRLRALFEHYLRWLKAADEQRGCCLEALAWEYDDRPGPVRSLLVDAERDWRRAVARIVESAVEHRLFRQDLDPRQVAFEFVGLCTVTQQTRKLLEDPRAEAMARAAFDGLLLRCLA